MGSEVASANKRIARNSFFLFGRLFVVLAISVYLTRVVLSALGVEDFGVYNAVCGFVLMFNVVNVALSNGIQRFYNFEASKNGAAAETSVYCTSALMQISMAVLLALIIEPIGLWFINHKMVIPSFRLAPARIVFHIAVASLAVDMIQVPYFSVITAHEKFNYYALVSLLEALLKLLLIVLVVSRSTLDRMIVYAIALFAVKIAVFFAYFIYAKLSFSTLRFSFEFDRKLFSSMSGFVGWNMVEMVAWTMEGQGINMLLNLFFGPLVNAARAVAAQVQNAIQYFCLSLMMSFRPQIVNSYAADDIQRTKELMFSLSKFMFVLFYMLSVPFIMDMDFVLNLWLGENIPEYTVAFTTLFLVSMYPRNFTMALSQVVHATGKMKKYQLSSATVVFFIFVFSWLALKCGAPAVAVYIIDTFMSVVLFIVSLLVFRTIFPLDMKEYLVKVILPCIALALVLPAALYLPFSLLPACIWRFLLLCTLSVVVGVAVSYLCILSGDEKAAVSNLVTKRFMRRCS